jgi:hypothetical protein
VKKKGFRKSFTKFLLSKGAIALPLTYLILLVSLITIISATYSYAVIRIAAKGASLKASTAKQNMQLLDNAVHAVAWTSGSSEVIYMDDTGGTFKTEPTSRNLIINITNEQATNEILFNDSIGEAFYELEPSEVSYADVYVRGDDRAVINQTAFTVTQLYGAISTSTQNLILSYRPMATATLVGASNDKPLNLIRIYLMTLNESQNMSLKGSFNLKITALNTTTINRQYEFNQSISSLELSVSLSENSGSVWLPISSNAQGAVVDLETVVCSIKLQRVGV